MCQRADSPKWGAGPRLPPKAARPASSAPSEGTMYPESSPNRCMSIPSLFDVSEVVLSQHMKTSPHCLLSSRESCVVLSACCLLCYNWGCHACPTLGGMCTGAELLGVALLAHQLLAKPCQAADVVLGTLSPSAHSVLRADTANLSGLLPQAPGQPLGDRRSASGTTDSSDASRRGPGIRSLLPHEVSQGGAGPRCGPISASDARVLFPKTEGHGDTPPPP